MEELILKDIMNDIAQEYNKSIEILETDLSNIKGIHLQNAILLKEDREQAYRDLFSVQNLQGNPSKMIDQTI